MSELILSENGWITGELISVIGLEMFQEVTGREVPER
jgi:hypothetical protein